jgi:hypothetical protein
MDASARLRAERRLVPAVTVEVPTPVGTITFEPIDERANPLELRFTCRHDGTTVRGGLRLKRPADPLALRVIDDAPDRILGPAWAAALIVYAELTCAEAPSEVEPASPAAARDASHRAATAPGGPQRRRPPGLPHGVRARAAPDADIRAWRAAVEELRAVAGPLRRLRDGHAASPEAVRAARGAGIQVPAGYTWVRPHRRASDQVFRIRWRASMQLW